MSQGSLSYPSSSSFIASYLQFVPHCACLKDYGKLHHLVHRLPDIYLSGCQYEMLEEGERDNERERGLSMHRVQCSINSSLCIKKCLLNF